MSVFRACKKLYINTTGKEDSVTYLFYYIRAKDINEAIAKFNTQTSGGKLTSISEASDIVLIP